MMANSIKVTFRFSFKGINYQPASILDLDKLMDTTGHIPALDYFVANNNDIDTYSYLFEVMQVSDIEFSEAQGVAVEFCHKHDFDIPGFEEKWRKQQIINKLQLIVQQYFDTDKQTENKSLMDALLAAYTLGLETNG
ncbi:hypothetical protein QUF61_03950 [Candidatus Venteria ishoeyi]|uniref:hypothetical protein n=1 Tax=Candidatus Venteria ishoeyi TaxID=1899563 RepID=UPI0025A5AAF0|nr:hypothetical protein [Candidatus Venteria ishoeyi]MDM8545628.1 hypothetical protein [Candidatus Venteria ishoeyi]